MTIYQSQSHISIEHDQVHITCACGKRWDIYHDETKADGYMGMVRRFHDHQRQMADGKETRA